MRIALVTEELARGAGSGGIGGAFHELALLLARQGHTVDLVFVPIAERADLPDMQQYYRAHGIDLLLPDLSEYIWEVGAPAARSYAVYRYIQSLLTPYDVLHFHDYKGLGHFCISAKRQELSLLTTQLIVQAHGPTRWTLQANGHAFSHEDQLKIDMMERSCVAGADMVVSPSHYMIEWFDRSGWALPGPDRVHVIQNPLGALLTKLKSGALPAALAPNAREIVLFARHEARKGIVAFCDALDILAPELADADIQVTFLGPLGSVNGEGSLIYLAGRARHWSFPIAILPDMGRDDAAAYLTARQRALVVVPSPVENSPYTVLEAIALGKPLLTSSSGGACELLDTALAAAMTCTISGPELAAAIRRVLATGLPAPQLAIPPAETDRQWLALHDAIEAEAACAQPGRPARRRPRVMVAITHHERPGKLFDALMSLARQTYENIEIVIVDDGSSSAATLDALKDMQPLLDRLGVRLIRQANAYLGAARNTAVRATQSEYVLFLDDDDIAFPTLVATLVTAAEATQADVVGCLNLFMDEARRVEAHPYPDHFEQKASYIPLGGPLALAPVENCFGSATALIRRTAFDAVHGYTEDKGVGHEDYEFYVRVVQSGGRIEICPVPLYLYEVGRPSMISRTSMARNYHRVAQAIDVMSQPGQWQDLVSLNSGRRAAEHEHNSRAYLNSISPFAPYLARLTHLNAGGAAYAATAAELAAAMGADSFGRAVTTLATRRHAAETRGGRHEPIETAAGLDVTHAPAARGRVIDPHIFHARLHLASADVANALAAFHLSVERNRVLTNEQQHFLIELAALPAADAEDLQPLLPAFRLLRGCRWTDERLAPVLFRLVLRAGARDLALASYDAVHDQDAEHYLAAHPDVRQRASDKRAALHHFHQHGRAEKRPGFAALQQLGAVLHEELGEPVDLMSIRETIAGLDADAGPGWIIQRPLLAAE